MLTFTKLLDEPAASASQQIHDSETQNNEDLD